MRVSSGCAFFIHGSVTQVRLDRICKDQTRKFCPSCGNATLLRASVTVSPPKEPGGQPTMEVHLKKNFQYRLRGTKYSIPAPKPGTAKSGTGDGLILREDQTAYARAAKMDASRREREERKMMAGALERGARGEQGGVAVGSWMDPYEGQGRHAHHWLRAQEPERAEEEEVDFACCTSTMPPTL
jgi:hypothetical protein